MFYSIAINEEGVCIMATNFLLLILFFGVMIAAVVAAIIIVIIALNKNKPN
jgi:hypothetical protein